MARATGRRATSGGRRRTAWKKAARLLAAGGSLREVARRAGCLRTALARKLEHDPHFRKAVEELRENGGREPASSTGRGDAPGTDARPGLPAG
jgi:hypothetical protein